MKRVLEFKDGEAKRTVGVTYNADGSFDLAFDNAGVAERYPGVRGRLTDDAEIEMEFDRELIKGTVVPDGDALHVFGTVRAATPFF